MSRWVKGALAALLTFIAIMASPLPASAREHPRLVLHEGAVSETYPAIAGVYPVHGAADRAHCVTVAGCDLIPMTIKAPNPDHSTDVLATITITWDPEDGNVLNAALFSDEDPPREGDPGRYDSPGLVKWTSGGADGSLVVRAANLRPGSYGLTVSNSTGENQGYALRAVLSRVGRAAASSAPGPSGIAAPGGETKEATTLARGDPAKVPAAHSRDIDRRYDGAVGVSSPAVATSPVTGAAGLLAAAAALLLIAVAIAWRRASRTHPDGGRWFHDLRLFWKLMAPFVLVIFVVGIVGTFLTARYLAGRADSELARRLVQGHSAAAGYLRDQEFTLLDATRFAANVQGLPEAVAASDAAAAERALASVAAVNEDLDVIAAVRPDGLSLATLSRTAEGITPHAGERWAEAPPVRSVLAGAADDGGDKHAGFLRLADGSALLVVAAPVRTADSRLGAVVVGRSAGKIVDEAADRSGAVVALYDGSEARVAASDNSVPETVRPVAAGESRRERDVSGGADVGRLVASLEVRDRPVGTLAVTVPLGSAFDAVRQTAIRLAVLVVVALAAIVAIGALLSRNILQTVRPLLATNRALGRGELAARAPVHGNDELGELAQGFNQMADQLEASYQQLERRVAERTEELQRLYRAREEFFASVSHELRTPLFAILANSELLTDPELAPDDPKEQAEFLGTIHVSAQQLVANVNDILDLARADAAAVRLNLGDVNLGLLLQEVTASVRALGRREDIEVSLTASSPLPVLTADRERIVQILLNLGSNAVKYTPSGGRVTISARSLDGAVEIDVADTGAGIPEEVGDSVFEPYYVVSAAGQHGHPSTGLGLAVAKRLVEAHGGDIGYVSGPGGTTFTVRLPVVPDGALPSPDSPGNVVSESHAAAASGANGRSGTQHARQSP